MNLKMKQTALFLVGWGLVFGTPIVWFNFTFVYAFLHVLGGSISAFNAYDYFIAVLSIVSLGLPYYGWTIIQYARRLSEAQH